MSYRPIETVEFRQPDQPSKPRVDPEAYALEQSLKSMIWLGYASSPRSHQSTIGASEVGTDCKRQLAYKITMTPPVNITDPLRALVGTGVHKALAEIFTRLDAGSGRFLVENDVRYKTVPGTCDLFDRLTGTVIDWKTTVKSKIGRIRNDGPSRQQIIQAQIYAAAYAEYAGETVRAVALAFIPVDSTLDDMYVWRTPYDHKLASSSTDLYNKVQSQEIEEIRKLDPSTVEKTPSPLCGWCPYHRPTSTDESLACRGKE